MSIHQSPQLDKITIHQSPQLDKITIHQSPLLDKITIHQSPQLDKITIHQSPQLDKITIDTYIYTLTRTSNWYFTPIVNGILLFIYYIWGKCLLLYLVA